VSVGCPEHRRSRRDSINTGSVRVNRKTEMGRDLELDSMGEPDQGSATTWLRQPSPKGYTGALKTDHRAQPMSVHTTPFPLSHSDRDGHKGVREYLWKFYRENGERCDSPICKSRAYEDNEGLPSGTAFEIFQHTRRHQAAATRPPGPPSSGNRREHHSRSIKRPGDLFSDILHLDADEDSALSSAQRPDMASVYNTRVATALNLAFPRSSAPLLCVVSTEARFLPTLNDLPEPCLQRIVELLGDLRSMCRCAMVCHKLWTVVPLVSAETLSFPLGLRLQTADATLALVQDRTLSTSGLVIDKRMSKSGSYLNRVPLPGRSSLPPLHQGWGEALKYGVHKLDLSGYTQLGAVFLAHVRCSRDEPVDLDTCRSKEAFAAGQMQPPMLPGSPAEILQRPVILLAKRLVWLDLSCNTALKSLDGLEICSSLTTLTLKGCTQLKDISALSTMQTLNSIELSDCAQLRDLSALGTVCHQVNLVRIGLSGCQRIRQIDVEPIKQCRGLEELRLAGLEYMSALDISATSPSETKLANRGLEEHSTCWPRLTKLFLNGCTHMDRIAPSLGIPAGLASTPEVGGPSIQLQPSMLRELDLSFCAALVHLDFLEDCTALKQINLACCTKLRCVAGLAHCSELTSLGMWGAEKVKSLDSVRSCQKLVVLDCTAMPELRPHSALSVIMACQRVLQAYFDEPIANFIQSRISSEAQKAEEVATVLNGWRSPPRRQRRLANGTRTLSHDMTASHGQKSAPISRRRALKKSIASCMCGARDNDSTGYSAGPVPGVS
jgi:hypothetical protein